MALFSILSNAASSLSAHRAASATHSHNLENVNTPGYARQRVNLAATTPAERWGNDFLGRGVSAQSITQARDPFIESQLPKALSAQARSSSHANALEGITGLDPAGGAGLTEALQSFYAGARALAQAPSDPGSRAAFVANAKDAALAFNRAQQSIDGARDGLDSKLQADAARATQLARSLADLNGQVRQELAAGSSPNDLLDARQKVQDELVQLTGGSVVPSADGTVSIVLQGGGALVSGDRAASMGTIADPTNGGHLALTLTTGSQPTVTMPNSALGGSMGGTLDARDGTLLKAEQALDTAAYDWATTVNTQHRAGYGLDGGTGRDLFTVGATSAGAASALVVDPAMVADPRLVGAAASAGGVPGDASNLQALIGTESRALASSGTSVFDTIANAIANFGAEVQGARTAATRDGAVADQLTTLRESVSGVSIDEELVALTQAQRGYEAVMKVITTADEMFDTLLKLR